jgi:predicted transposase/invertase (TIGR01784 family)
MNKIHDKTFRDIFSEKEHAIGLIQSALTAKMISHINMHSLVQESETFISKSMKDLQSDLLFSVQTKKGRDLKVYILFEHKSASDPEIHKQLSSYLDSIYRKMKLIRPVIPIVFYHGKDGWKVPESLIDTMNLDPDELELFGPYIPDFRYILFDLNKINPETLILSLTLHAVLATFKNIWTMNQAAKFEETFIKIAELSKDNQSVKVIEKLLRYIYGFTSIHPDTIMKKAELLEAITLQEINMTTAQKLREEGKLEGKLEGEYEKAVKTARAMIKEGDSIEKIKRVTDLTLEEIERIADGKQ